MTVCLCFQLSRFSPRHELPFIHSAFIHSLQHLFQSWHIVDTHKWLLNWTERDSRGLEMWNNLSIVLISLIWNFKRVAYNFLSIYTPINMHRWASYFSSQYASLPNIPWRAQTSLSRIEGKRSFLKSWMDFCLSAWDGTDSPQMSFNGFSRNLYIEGNPSHGLGTLTLQVVLGTQNYIQACLLEI